MVKTATPAKISKLPKWARDEIEGLQREVLQLRDSARLLRNMINREGSGNTRLLAIDDRLGPLSLDPSRTSIRFRTGPDPVDDFISIRLLPPGAGGIGLQVMGGRGIQVRPWASNVAHVQLEAARGA